MFGVPSAGLWLLTVIVLAVSVRRHVDRLLAGVLALHWLWSGILYHWLYFATINPAARLFAILFAGQAGLFAWLGIMRGHLEFRWGRRLPQVLGAVLIVYGLVYPALVVASGLHWPRMPAFGVPCPTTLVTLGLLLELEPRAPRALIVIPVIWALVGGSAALLLGVLPDSMLLVGGAAALVAVISPRPLRRDS